MKTKVQNHNLNKPTKTEIKSTIFRWTKYGIPRKSSSIKNTHPILHKKYLELKKKQYFYFKGINTGLTDLEYDKLKREIHTEIANICEIEYYKGSSFMEDVLYDKIRSDQESRTFIHKDSQIHRESPIKNKNMGKIIPASEENYHILYQIDRLKKERPKLHQHYMDLQKDRYLYYDNRNKLTPEEYIKKKYKIHSKIVEWAHKNYYNGKKSMTDQLYDHFRQNLFKKNSIHHLSFHKDNQERNLPKRDMRNKFLNKLDLNQARYIQKIWMRNGRFFVTIQDLKDHDFELHERYLNLKKNQFYFYRGVQPDMNNVEYEKEKFTVYNLIKLWEKNNRQKGDNKITDILSSYFDQHNVKKTFLNHLSSNEFISHGGEDQHDMEYTQGKFLDQKDAEQRWNLYGENIYKIDILKNQNPQLHDKWIKICRTRYLYLRGIRGIQTYEEYIKDRFNTTSEIIQWAKHRYYKSLPSMTDYRYDQLTQILYPRTINSNS